ncbi:acyltransferase family protein [Nocardioides sp.]|uniref:acyltransferase family protein n=1 Tax=Nocardioides sp. TaxID=35761 RepID=UPI0035152EEF
MPSRDPWLDNAKMGLVTLVVVGHLLAYLPADGPGGKLYDVVYLWHMPAFVLITGYLSRNFAFTRRRMWQLFSTLLVPYLFFEGALAWFRTVVGGEKLRDLWIDPHFPVWYLLAVVAWRLLTPLFRSLPPLVGIGLAVAIAMAGSFLTGDWTRYLDLPRLSGFLPFFVIGLNITPQRLQLVRGRLQTGLALGAVAVIVVLGLNLDRWAARGYLYQRPIELLDDATGTFLLTRVAVLVVGLVGTAAWLALISRRGGWFSRMGAATMVVYLVHGFAVKGLDYAGFGDWVEPRPLLGTAAAVVLGVAIALVLACTPVRRPLEPVVDPFATAEEAVGDAVQVAVVVSEHEAGGGDVAAGIAAVEEATTGGVGEPGKGEAPAPSSGAVSG